MDKVFNVEIDGQITLPDGRKLGPFEETTVNVVQPSEGGSDPIVENAKSTGGIGYTEQGEQTVITWDGDTEGREVFAVGDPMYKVSNKIITQSDVIGGEHGFSDGTTVPITEGRIFDLASVGIENAFGISFEEGSPSLDIMCVQNDTVFADTPISAGVYFLYGDAGYVSSLTYGTPDTIHKIDEKYLPEAGGGGVKVFNIFVDDDDNIENIETCNELLAFYKEHGRTDAYQSTVFYDNTEYKLSGVYYGNDNYVQFAFSCVNPSPGTGTRITSCNHNVIALEGNNNGNWYIYFGYYQLSN